MQILLGTNETIIKINSKSMKIDYIQHYIKTHFLNIKIKDNSMYIGESHDNIYHRTFLLKWLYSLYVRKNKELPKLKESLISRYYKAIKIVTSKNIVHEIIYKVLDENTLSVKIYPYNQTILNKLKLFLQAEVKIKPTCMHIKLDTKKKKERLKKLFDDEKIIYIPHKHSYDEIKMNNFIFKKQECLNILIQKAYTILGVSQIDDKKTIKKQYRLLAKKFHPDTVYANDEKLKYLYTKKFQEILNAYEIINKSK